MNVEAPQPASVGAQSRHRRPHHRPRRGNRQAAGSATDSTTQNTEVTNSSNSQVPSPEGPQGGESTTNPKRRRPPRRRGPRPQNPANASADGASEAPESSSHSATPLQPLPVPSVVNANPPAQPAQHNDQHKSRGHPRGMGGRSSRGISAGQGTRFRPGRKFGGHLTADTDQSESAPVDGSNGEADSRGLRADAPSFEPGQSMGSAPTGPRGGRRRGGRPQPKELSEEELASEDIMARIHREIDSGDYECMICYSNISRRAKIWYCRCCWAVYHLNCVQKWGKQGLSQPARGPVGADGEPPRVWRCPACNDPNEELPQFYTCWCEKSVQPDVTKFLPPHSCGQTCGKQRSSPKNCPHNCDLQCHAGPCPPCTAMGTPMACYCAKEESQRRCIDTDYVSGWSCGQICGELMPCGEHVCEQPCHPGLCGNCEVKELLQCYCGNETREIKCCDKGEPTHSRVQEEDGEVDQWDGYFSCGKSCDRYFDCGIHHCEKSCHPMDLLPVHCPLSPDVIKDCPCGKTPLDKLTSPRQNCEAPIPTCGKVCNKRLKCGHQCTKLCHEGECGVCLKNIDVVCRCGKTTSKSLCHQGEEHDRPMCMRTCRVTLNCGRHECGEKCCPGEQKAQERLAMKKKGRPFGSTNPSTPTDDNFESEHICTRPCGRLLKCGQHSCPMLCHRGPCGTCLEASFEELTCNCGRTAIQPPVPCGSKPPPCRFPCTRPKNCGHPRVPHDCHTDETSCPKCPYLVDKLCLCGRKTVKAIPCFRDVVSCGTPCGRKLACGSHSCRKVCHDGPCESPCKQQCRKPKSACGHPCLDACHAPFQCSEDKPCPEKITLTCACGGLKSDTKCGATKSDPTGNKKELKCTDACRSRRLALALQIDPERDTEALYSQETITAYNRDKKWALQIEARFRSFANNPDQKRLQFPPMRSQMREFLHFLAEDYGLESESQDPEPYRSVVVRKGNSFTAPPRKTIVEFLVASKSSSTTGATDASVTGGIQQLRKARPAPVNGFLLQHVRIGLLAPELEKELLPTLSESQLRFNITWHGDESVLLAPKTSSLSADQLETEIRNIAPALKRRVAATGLAENVELCFIGADGKVGNREAEKWSLVGSGVRKPAQPVSNGLGQVRNRFDLTPIPKEKTMLKKKSKEKVEVLDSWEMEAEADEEEAKKEEEGKSGDEGSQKADSDSGPSAEVDTPVSQDEQQQQQKNDGDAAVAEEVSTVPPTASPAPEENNDKAVPSPANES